MKFLVDQKIFEKFPDVKIGVVVCQGVNNRKSGKEILKLLRSQEEYLRSFRLVVSEPLTNEVGEFYVVKAWQEVYRKFGADPKKYKSSIESLLLRIAEDKSIPGINPLVNLYNYFSLKYLLPFGGEDLDKVRGDIWLTFADGSERGVYLGGGKIVTAAKGEVVYKDGLGFICRRWNWREAERTKLTEQTENAIFGIELLEHKDRSDLKTVIDEFSKSIEKYLGGAVISAICSKDNPVFEFDFVPGSKLTKQEIEDRGEEKKLVAERVRKSYTGAVAEIVQAVEEALVALKLPKIEVEIEHPAQPEHGDYSSSVAMRLASRVKGKPRGLAQTIVNAIKKPDFVEKIEVAPPGFINFWLSKTYLVSSVFEIIKEKDKFGSLDVGKGIKAMIEYGQPNTHKLPHVGHFRSYTIGESLARILDFSGYETFRANYQGDVGLHVAKCLWGYQQKGYQESKDLTQNIHDLQKAYVYGSKMYEESEEVEEEIDALGVKIYQKDKSIIELWKKTRQWSIDYYDRMNKHLGTTYQRLYFESEAAAAGKKIVLDNLGTVFEKSEGAVIFPGEKYGLHNRVFITSKGNPTYEAKDLGLIFLKKKDFDYDLSLISTASEQIEYFKVVYKAAEQIAPELAKKFVHIPFGLVSLSGGKLSSRKGNIVSIDELLETVEKAAAEIADQSLEEITVGAAKYSMLHHTPIKDIVFDIKESVALEGNSGPYLQYTYARARSVLHKSRIRSLEPVAGLGFTDEEIAVLRTLYQFPEVVAKSLKEFAPHHICDFLFDLAQKFNAFYQRHRIMDAPEGEETVRLRLALTVATAQVIRNGLYLLGIEAPERM